MKQKSRALLAVLLAFTMAFGPTFSAGAVSSGKGEDQQIEVVDADQVSEETEAKETKAPETKAPETEAPETKAPETKAPETKAPETEAPETEAPETKAPETKAPETEAPETKVPETEAPETKAPETEAAESKEQETEAAETTAVETEAEESSVEETTELETTEAVPVKDKYTYSDKKIQVTAKLSDPSVLPDEAELVVTPLTEKTEGYNYDAYMDALNNQAEEGQTFTADNTLLYDIAFMYQPLDEEGQPEGNLVEVEPEDGKVDLVITFKKAQLSEGIGAESGEDVQLVHLPLKAKVRNKVDSTKDATNIKAKDILVEEVDANTKIGSKEQIKVTLDNFSVIAAYKENGITYNPATDKTSSVNYNTVLGDAVEYGILADTYNQTLNHTQTNFATNKYIRQDAGVVEADLSGSGTVPFIVSNMNNGMRFGGSTSTGTKTQYDVYTDEKYSSDGASKFTIDNKEKITVNPIYQSTATVTGSVNSMIGYINSQSAYLNNKPATIEYPNRLSVDLNNVVIDTTMYDDDEVIYINVLPGSDLEMVIAERHLIINKKSGQNVVFNMQNTNVKVRNYDVRINGKDIGTQTSQANTPHNKDVDKEIVRKIIWNMPNATNVTLQDTAGLFLVPNRNAQVNQSGGASGGWVATGGTMNGAAEWHFTFENRKYSGSDASAQFSAKKVLNGKTLEANKFQFVLKDGSGKILQTVSNAADGSVTFDPIKYVKNESQDDTGTYTYKISEVIPAGANNSNNYTVDGITYDTHEKVVTVRVENANGKLTVTYDGNNSFASEVFTNTYNTYKASGETQFAAKKVLNGNVLKADQFTFTLKENGKLLQTKKNKSDGSISFDKITYTAEDLDKDEKGNYKETKKVYKIAEIAGNTKGYTYDGHEETITVTLKDDGKGHINTSLDRDLADIVFTNSYATEGETQFAAKKVLNGNDLKADQFTFTLQENGKLLQTKKNKSDGSISFDKITYTADDLDKDEAGEYKETKKVYKIAEIAGNTKGYTYDDHEETITVTLKDDGEGHINTSLDRDLADIVFINTYNTYATEGETQFAAKKVLNGNVLKADQFTFTLKENGKLLQTKKNKSDGSISFDKITYTADDLDKDEAGEYKETKKVYKIAEIAGNTKGYTYDDHEETITVTLKDDGEGHINTSLDRDLADIVFTNTYATEGETQFAAKKVLNGNVLQADQFTFTLKENGKLLQTKKNKSDGSISFDKITYTADDLDKDEAGEYKETKKVYKIAEIAGNTKGYTYDDHEETITVTLKDDGEGHINTSLDRDLADIVFTNTYATEGETQFAAKKVLNGNVLQADQFTFTLKENGKLLQTKKNKSDGSISFDKITYTADDLDKDEAGEYKETKKVYKIAEIAGNTKGYTYDDHEETITVTLKDDGEGHINTSLDRDLADIVFTNTYATEGETQFAAKKVLNGNVLQADQFTFTLKENGKLLQTKKNKSDGSISFDKITYTADDLDKDEAGEYKETKKVYKIAEIAGNTKGYTYDDHEETITVTLKDDGEGHINTSLDRDLADIVFTNTYATEGETQFAAKKVLNGNVLQADQFTFTLKENGKLLQTKKNKSDGSISFDKITYTADDLDKDEAGEYKETKKVYKIAEIAGNTKGYTYDDHEETITVTLKDDGEGHINTSLDRDLADIVFTNTYATEGETQFAAKKVLNGNVLQADQFTFTLKENGKLLQTKKNKSDGSISFDKITYTADDLDKDEAGEYKETKKVYKIAEIAGNTKGYTYDDHEETITVTLKDDGEGHINTSLDRDLADIVFTNTYATEGETQFAAKKVLNGNVLQADQFTFTLKENGKLLQTKKNKSDGSISFDKITYTADDLDKDEAGEYKETKKVYKIAEIAGNTKGYTYDDHEETITVTLKDDGEGHINTSLDRDLADIVFTNTYATEGETQFAAKKVLNGNVLQADQFTFTLKENGKLLQTKKNKSDGSISFDKITYTADDLDKDEAGEYKETKKVYKIAEIAGNTKGYTYDDHEETITVTLKDDGEGHINTSLDKKLADIVFTNTYEATGAASFSASKTLTGKKLEAFEFELKEVKEGQDDVLLEKVSNAEDGRVTFKDITYIKNKDQNDTGTHTYTISEVLPEGVSAENPTQNGITYDTKAQTVVVNVTDNGDGTLKVTYGDDEETSFSPVKFVNQYNTEGQAQLFATKTLTNKELKEGQFSFELKEDDKVLQTKPIDANGVAVFDPITYKGSEEHTYTISEVLPEGVSAENPTQDGITYDTTIHTVKVAAVDNGKGKVDVTYDGAKVFAGAEFTNTYAAEGKAELEATKNLNGNVLKADQFTFTLKENGKVLQTKSNNADGSVIFDEIGYTLTDVGEHVYTIAEVMPTEATEANNYTVDGYTYDPSETQVTVKVTDNGDGTLKVTYDGKDTFAGAAFTNSYATEGKTQFGAKKVLNGRPLEGAQFEFTLMDENGKVLQTKTNETDGSITFDEINYTAEDLNKDEAGNYVETKKVYTIVEKTEGAKPGYTYDDSVETITVTLKENGDGQILTSLDRDLAGIVFTNTYVASGAYSLTAQKTLEGAALTEGQFEFELLDAEGKVLETAKNDADGKVEFGAIGYSQADVYADGNTSGTVALKYTIREVIPAGAKDNGDGTYEYQGYTYDGRERAVTVTLTDNGEGVITASIAGDGTAASFKNTYDAAGQITLTAEKELEGRNLKSGEFEFVLKDEDGKTLQTVTNDGDGKIYFDTITYSLDDLDKDKNGNYVETEKTYTVEEKVGKDDTITYDKTVYEVTVTLKDKGDGSIEAVADVEDGDIVFTNKADDDCSIQLTAKKVLDGGKLEKDQFTFLLKDADGKTLQTKTNDKDGQVTFDEITYTLDDIGTHTYKISEKDDKQKDITYDTTVYTVKVTVALDKDGKLTAKADRKTGSVKFTNKKGGKTGKDVKTGDDNNKNLWFLLMIAALCGFSFAGVSLVRKPRRANRRRR